MGRFINGTTVDISIAPLVLCKRYVPTDQTIAVAAATANDPTITATAPLTADLAKFSTLTVDISGVTRYIYVDADVLAGGTNIPVKGMNFDLPAGNVEFIAKQPIANTTEASFELTANAQEFYFLNNQASSFKDETTVTGEWSVPITTNLQLETPAQNILGNASVDLILNDRECYMWLEYITSACVSSLGFTGKTTREGVICVMEYSESAPGDNIVTISATLSGRGAVTTSNFYDN
ncbi:MAG: hypothetical protein QNJ38_01385 [Prochloraceae cyanobacterium]|nr:hypothetical protein [Prochloraceae cyanobacterium]